MPEYTKPLPRPTNESAPFWEGCRRHELVIQRCEDCGVLIHYPKAICPGCQGSQLGWVRASGLGRVHTYTVIHRAFHPGFAEEVPYVAAVIELDEGVRLLSNLAGVDPQDVHVGMPVEVFFEEVTPDVTLPKFRPVR